MGQTLLPERHNDGGDPSIDTAWSREPKDALETAWHQPEDSGQVEEAQFNGRSSNWSNSSQVHRLVHRAGGRHRCVSQAHSAAAG